MSPLELLAMAGQAFRAQVSGVEPAAWGRPTPCEGWSVRELTNHVVAGNRRVVLYLVDGSGHAEAAALVEGDLLGDDPLGACERTLDAQFHAFDGGGALERTCEIGVGEVTGRQLLRFRTLDLVVHAWDLARALESDETLDPVLVEETWRDVEPLVPTLGSLGVFGDGPSGTLDGDAPLQRRLLDACGRRP